MKEAAALVARSRRYLRSAEILLEDGDHESCVSRVYYAMFYCAEVEAVNDWLDTFLNPGA